MAARILLVSSADPHHPPPLSDIFLQWATSFPQPRSSDPVAVSMHKETMGSDGGYHSLCRLIQPRPSLHLLVSSSIRYDLSLPLSLFEDYWFYIFLIHHVALRQFLAPTVDKLRMAAAMPTVATSSPILDSVSNMTLFP